MKSQAFLIIPVFLFAIACNTKSTAPTVTLSAGPAAILLGQSSTLTWDSTNATSVQIDKGIGSVPLSGTLLVSPTATTTYTITASGPDGTAMADTKVTVTCSLTIEMFGQGAVSDNGIASDRGEACSGVYEKDKVVTLKATPEAGWAFHHWSGCDTKSGDSCTVKMNLNRVVFATFNKVETTLNPNVILLNDETLKLLKARAGNTFIFDISATDMAALKVGDVFISRSGKGFARKASNVSVIAGSVVLIETTGATLQDIIQDGTIIYNKRLSASQVQSSQALMAGARLLPSSPSATEFTIEIEHDMASQAKLVGSVTFSFETDFGFAASLHPPGVREFKTIMHINKSADLKLIVDGSLPFVDKELKIWKFTFTPIPVGPIVLVPEIEVNLKLNGEASAEVSTGISGSEAAYVGMHYLKSTGWRKINQYGRSIGFEAPQCTGTLSLQAGIGAETSIMIFDVAGPSIEFEAYLQAEANKVLGGSEDCIDWGLYFGVSASGSAELQVPLLGWTITKFVANFLDKKWLLKDGKSASCEDTEAPAVPQNLKAKVFSSTQIILTWDEATDNVRVDRYAVYREGKRYVEARNASYDDVGLTPVTMYCYSVAAVDASGNESPLSTAVCATTDGASDDTPPTAPTNLQAAAVSTSAIKLTWGASTDASGVKGYVVSRDDLPVIRVAGNVKNATETSLKPGTQYCYNVSAFDAAGNESPASNTACAKTLASGKGTWNVYIKCVGQDYQIHFNLDLDETITTFIQVNGIGDDYNGQALSYLITGIYNKSTKTLTDGKIRWFSSFTKCLRVDEFQAYLGSGDSGDITTNQTSVCGCASQIRFTKTLIDLSNLDTSERSNDGCTGFLDGNYVDE
jgi:chitodextrinase